MIHTFAFESDEPGGRFDCVLDIVSAATTTTQAIQYRTISNGNLKGTAAFPDVTGTQVLRDGKYTFTVRPIDLAGNFGDRLEALWYLDTIAPDVEVVQPATHSDTRRTDKDWATFVFKPLDQMGASPVGTFFFALDCLRKITTCKQASRVALPP